MPVQECSENGKPGYKFGTRGKCYTYSPGNEAGRKRAKQKATLQGIAAGESIMEDLLENKDIQEWLEGREEQDLDGYWKELVESGEAEKYEQKRPQEKPGGSNVGRYARVKKFCGPSGGAPKGSFPVNTRKRAIAALSYARNAPRPSGIRTCVCRNWPTLPACQKKESASMVETENFIDDCFRGKSGKLMMRKS